MRITMGDHSEPSRRAILGGASALMLLGRGSNALATLSMPRAEAVPARFVRLRPSAFSAAFEANRRYLLSLDPRRFLHNFYVSAGLPAPAPGYGGWEAQGIAGHSLGHWLSACSLVVANTGDAAVAARLDCALAEMARIQAAHGDGYCGGTTVERDGKVIDGRIVFEEIRRGDIRSDGFDLNGGWVPIYTWHKIHAGLIDAHALAGRPQAMSVMLGVAEYLAGVLEPLDDGEMQRVLATEHGGINESYASTYALTGDSRWLRLAERLRHRAVLDPLSDGRDQLAGLHANTQIPKVIGLARLYEVTGSRAHADAARFFHETVTCHHSYVIGGNSEREHFGPPDRLAARLTEATCEACNSYNMLKLTRHLYSWEPHARWFDYYERVQLNHILASQRPTDGRFVYFMPLATGSRRTFSTPEDSFWCCVGTGMESHAKHADSIFWSQRDTLYLNLFVPADLDWPERNLALTLDTSMPATGAVTMTFRDAPRSRMRIALRIPEWTREPKLRLNGKLRPIELSNGYAIVEREFRSGDELLLELPMPLTVQAVPDDPSLIAFRSGPLVLAADLGPAIGGFEDADPALVVVGHPADALATDQGNWKAESAAGGDLAFRPFYAQWDRRSAVYVQTFTPSGWSAAKERFLATGLERRELSRRTVDVLHLGEMQPERDHAFAAPGSEIVNWNGRSARRLRRGGRMRFDLVRRPGPAALRLVLWGGSAKRLFSITVDGTPVADVARPSASESFVDVEFPLPAVGAQGRRTATIEIAATDGDAAIYEVRMLASPISGRSSRA